MSTRRQRRAGRADERRAGVRRLACPWCKGMVIMHDAQRRVSHTAPVCAKMQALIAKGEKVLEVLNTQGTKAAEEAGGGA